MNKKLLLFTCSTALPASMAFADAHIVERPGYPSYVERREVLVEPPHYYHRRHMVTDRDYWERERLRRERFEHERWEHEHPRGWTDRH